MKIPITKPTFDKEEYELITKPLGTGWIVQGPYVKEFERYIAEFTGAEYAVAVNSCTSGQFILSRVIDLQPEDEVIVPSFTVPLPANPVLPVIPCYFKFQMYLDFAGSYQIYILLYIKII